MKLFTFRSLVVATETHEDGGYHYHVGVLNENASRYKCFKQIRALFPGEADQCQSTQRMGNHLPIYT